MELRALLDELLADIFRLWPVTATDAGEHRHDGRWPNISDEGRQERIAFLGDAERRLAAIDSGPLSLGEAADRRVMLDQLASMRFAEERLREPSWNPLWYVYLLGGGLFTLLTREFAPVEVRLESAGQRLRGIPQLLTAARGTLSAPGERAVSRLHGEKALERLPGIGSLADALAGEAERTGNAALAEAVGEAARIARSALADFGEWLREELLPRADGDFRLGAELHGEKFRHALMTDLAPEELQRQAEMAYAEVRAEMARLARQLWPAWVGDGSIPADDGEVVRAVLDRIAAEHPRAEELLDFCRAENERIETFVREVDLIGLPDDPIDIIWTPEFLRSFGGAMLISPGPLDRGLKSFFAITPMPDDWTDDQRESYLREDNIRMLRLLTVHEAVPGHYLQLAWANRCDSLPRTVFGSGVFAEGWAVYITQVMIDVGYGADDPALMLVHWKFFLRSITNALMDIGIHAGSMDEEEAMRLMIDGGFQEQSEAAEKWNRARLSSTQLCEYYLGSVEMTELEREARRRAAVEGREFAYRPFLESVISHGTPPPRVARELIFG